MLLKRIKAYLLDILFIFFLVSLVTSIKFLNPTYEQYIENLNNYQQVQEEYVSGNLDIEDLKSQTNKYYYNLSENRISYNIITIVILFGYFVLFQKYNGGQTLGKKIMKIKIIGKSDNVPSIMQYSLRLFSTYFVYVGSIIPLIFNSLLVFVLNENVYIYATNIINYLCLTLSLVSIISINKNSEGIEDKISKTIVIKTEES